MQNNISTNRLLLNLLTKEDHEFILQLLNSQGWIKFIGDRNVHSKEEAVAYINKILASENLFYWIVRIQGENLPVGIISFIKRSYLDYFDIGFAFLPEYNGYGYAYEAAQKILFIMSGQLNHHPILATTKPGNTKSIKLLNKLGLHFKKELNLESEMIHIYSNAASTS
ncbi:MAG: GNAT family N-acetyltransferase [Parafilimonas sp.]